MADGRRRGNRLKAAAAVLVLAVAGAAGWAMWGDRSGTDVPAAVLDRSLVSGEMAAFLLHPEPREVPAIAFRDGEDRPVSLGDWKGRVVLINLWATWCAPCRREMPSLDALQAKLGGDDFEVVAISVDRKGIPASKAFLEDTGSDNLALYVDPTLRVNADLKAHGLPATILIDREGRERGRLVGPAEWDSDDALALIRAAMATDS